MLDIYDGLPFDNDEEKTNIAKVLDFLEKYFIGETIKTYERYLFNKREQESGESFDAYLTNLRSLVKTCNFGELKDNLIRDRIVIGIKDNSIRKKLPAEGKLTLDKCINICCANETTAKQLKEISQSEDVNAIIHRHPQRKAVSYSKGSSPEKGQRSPPVQPTMIKCKFCSKTHSRKKESRPAWQKTCKECGQLNHFSGSVACKSDKQHQKRSRYMVSKISRMIMKMMNISCSSNQVAL